MKILSASQIKKADQYTIENEPISSLKLMERAARALSRQYQIDFSKNIPLALFCGQGNNGGDGLALARLLFQQQYRVKVYVVQHTDSPSEDFSANLAAAHQLGVPVEWLKEGGSWPSIAEETVLADAILGSGLSRPLRGFIAAVVAYLNQLPNLRLAIDIPTGLFADDNSENELSAVFKADKCYTLQQPKLSLVDFRTVALAGEVSVLDIGLDQDFIDSCDSSYHFLEAEDFHSIYQPRTKHSYKGNYGHALLVAGHQNSMGAAIMSARAALRSGAGLLTAHIPAAGSTAMNVALPEAMLRTDSNPHKISESLPLKDASATAAGPGLGQDEETAQALAEIIVDCRHPMVLDADALNLLSKHEEWYLHLPAGSILTPHPGELKRLLGWEELPDDYLNQLRQFSRKQQLIVIMKYSLSAVVMPAGEIYFIDEGSAALASAGSGDVLTGVILGLLASGYSPENAALLAVYLQGRAGSLAGNITSAEACLASDVIEQLPAAFRSLS